MEKIVGVREKIKQLSESEAKSLLFMIYAKLDIAVNGNGGDPFLKQTVSDLYHLYHELPEQNEGND